MGNANPAAKSSRGAALQAPADGPAAPRRQSLLGMLYGVATWLQFLLAAALALPILLLMPRLSRRRALVSGLARLALRLAGMRLEVRGLDQL
ncbi:MAG TPA: hypothetical protein VII41_10680, partial [Steroidobacteraceae bacterium]